MRIEYRLGFLKKSFDGFKNETNFGTDFLAHAQSWAERLNVLLYFLHELFFLALLTFEISNFQTKR